MIAIDVYTNAIGVATAIGRVTILAAKDWVVLRMVSSIRIDARKYDNVNLLHEGIDFR